MASLCYGFLYKVCDSGPKPTPGTRSKEEIKDRMEDYCIDGESVSFGSSSKRKAEDMLGSKDGDVHTSMANKGSKWEDETGAGTESSGEGEGMINNLISTLFRPGDEGGGEIEAESGSSKRVNDKSASEDGNENGHGGTIRSIILSLLPTTLSGTS